MGGKLIDEVPIRDLITPTGYDIPPELYDKTWGDMKRIDKNQGAGDGGVAKQIKLEEKKVTIDANGKTEVLPDKGADGLSKVVVDVAVPAPPEKRIEAEKRVSVTQNGVVDVVPSLGYDGLAKASVDVNIPEKIYQTAPKLKVPVTTNGIQKVETPEGYDGISEVELTVAVPEPAMDENKRVTIDRNGEHEISPSADMAGMKKATVEVAVPLPLIDTNAEATLTTQGVHVLKPHDGFDAIGKATVNVAVPIEEERSVRIARNGETVITAEAGKEGIKTVKVDVDVAPPPYERDKRVSIDSNGVHEIAPQAG